MHHHESRTENYYATLGLHQRCTGEQIRAAYRLLAKQYHPDLNPGPDAAVRIQLLNAAHEVLGDPDRREAYDQELAQQKKRPANGRTPKTPKAGLNVTQEIDLPIEDFFRGSTLTVRVNDPANPNGAETYPLVIPAGTAPGARFRVPREEPFAGGFVLLRVRPRPGFRFKVRGFDLRCDLTIKPERATQGRTEQLRGVDGSIVRVVIPARVARGETIRIADEGLPKPRGGRGDLLVRITYRVEVRVTRSRGD